MQSEASEVTLGGKAHVGPGCVCATRHQPSCLDRGIPFPCIFCACVCVPPFPFHDYDDYIGRRSFGVGSEQSISGGTHRPPPPSLLRAYIGGGQDEVTLRNGSARPTDPALCSPGA